MLMIIVYAPLRNDQIRLYKGALNLSYIWLARLPGKQETRRSIRRATTGLYNRLSLACKNSLTLSN